MDAREYLARKGLDGDRDRERPNTLEEKAWERARESGDHRPRAGTPHDWEDWERYHEELAEGADDLEQKIDHEAHRQALEHDEGGVQHFDPAAASPAAPQAEPDDAGKARDAGDAAPEPTPARDEPAASTPTRAEPFAALVALAVLLPPLATGLAGRGGRRVLIALALTLLGWLPGVAYALVQLRRAPRG